MQIRLLMPLVLVLGFVLAACQQADTTPKLAVVDMGRIMRDSEPGKAGVKFLEALQADMQTQLNSVQTRLEKDPKDEAAQKELQSVYMNAQQRMQTEQQNVVSLLYDSIQRVLNAYREQKGLEVILNAEAVQAFSPKADVTADIITEMNKQKVDFKAAATPAEKGMPMPAADAKKNEAQKDGAKKDEAKK